MNRRRVASWLTAFGLGFAFTTVAAFAFDVANDPPRGQRLGELDLYRYCGDTYGRESSATLLTNSAHSWRCVVFNRGAMDQNMIDFDAACTANFGVEAYAATVEPHGPYTWQCYYA